MANDERQGVWLGTLIDAAESELLSRKQPKTSRAPRVWEQIATDERGRRRLHGAFTGGFSAGYFNTVATKGGFTPRTFRTSRSQRAEETTQRVQDFYDEDELEEQRQVEIATQDVYDTFATGRNEKARERTEQEANARPIIPGDIISEFVEGVSESIGVQLLQRMGWRQGKGIGEAFQQSTDSKWGPDASLSQQSSSIWKEKAKVQQHPTNVHGLGFDPFRGSRAFERHSRAEATPQPKAKRSRGIAFGVGVLEETDTFGEVGDYVEQPHDGMNYYDLSDHSDEDKPSHKKEQKVKRIGHRSSRGKETFVSGFHLGAVLHEMKSFELPVVPPNFVEKRQTSMQPSGADVAAASQASVPTPQFPADESLKKRIDSVAVFVAKGGVMSEELARQEHMGDEAFSFLFGGDGSDYYRWKLLDVKVTFQKLGVECTGLREAPLTADDRGFLLGDKRIKEEPIKSRAVSHPFIQGVPEADRTRVKTALDSTFVRGTTEGVLHTDQSEPAGLRASRPKELGESKEEVPEKRTPQPADLTPVRSFMDWHPVPLLYKRFNVLDPLKGMPRETETKSKFMSYESGLDQVKAEEPTTSITGAPTISIADEIDTTMPPPEYTEPPLDIFKSIFDASSSSDEEEESEKAPPQQDSEKKKEEVILPQSINEERPPATTPGTRKRLNIASDESEEDREEKKPERRSKKEKKKRRKESKSEDEFDDSVLSGLSTSEFKKLLKTLKKSRAKKKAKKEAKRKRREGSREHRSSKS